MFSDVSVGKHARTRCALLYVFSYSSLKLMSRFVRLDHVPSGTFMEISKNTKMFAEIPVNINIGLKVFFFFFGRFLFFWFLVEGGAQGVCQVMYKPVTGHVTFE